MIRPIFVKHFANHLVHCGSVEIPEGRKSDEGVVREKSRTQLKLVLSRNLTHVSEVLQVADFEQAMETYK